MELNWLGGQINMDAVEAYISPNTGIVAIGVSADKGFVPILVFEDFDSVVKFIIRLNHLLESHILQNGNTEVPEVFMKAFDTDDSVSGTKH